MRLNLYWRGVDLIDVELHLCRPRREAEETVVVTLSSDAQVADDQPFGFTARTPK